MYEKSIQAEIRLLSIKKKKKKANTEEKKGASQLGTVFLVG